MNGIDTDFAWLSPSILQVSSAPASGATVQVRRQSSHVARLTDFVDSSTLTETTLDLAADQAFMMSQEALDTAVDSGVAADLAKQYASDAVSVSGVHVPIYSSRASASGSPIPLGAAQIRVSGYSSPGDGGEALYTRVGSEPTHPGKFQDADGFWWALSERRGTPQMMGARGNGSVNDTAALQAAINFFDVVYLPAGVYVTGPLAGKSNVVIEGAGRDLTILKRIPNAPDNNPVLYFIGKSNIRVRNLTVDGNRANQTLDGSVVTLSGGCYDYHFEGVKFTGNRGVNWTGLQTMDGANQVQKTRSTVTRCVFTGLDGFGAYVSKDSNIDFFQCVFKLSLEGLVFLNFTPPSSATERNWSVVDCEFSDLTGSGLSASGYIVGYNGSGQPIQGYGKETSFGALIRGNRIRNCVKYGLVYQGTHAVISGNLIESCGSDTSNGGVLLNSSYVTFSDNIVHANYFYGVDAGSALQCSITGNTFSFNGQSSGISGTGLNLGASSSNSVIGNKFIQNGVTGSGTNISIPGYDGGTDPVFELTSSNLLIKSNEFHLGDNARFAVSCDIGDPVNIVLRDNDCFGSGAHSNPFYVTANQFYHSKNLYWNGNVIDIVVGAQSTVVIPDHADEITITGTGNIDNIRTYSANTYAGKVRSIRITNGGSGYQPGASFAVTFSGGGGAGATGSALVSNSGKVKAVIMGSFGSGYTSAPAVSFALGGGSGAAGTALVGANNTDGNYLTVFLQNGAVLKNSTGNLSLAGGDFIGNGFKSITLFSRNGGTWFEVSRS